MVIGYSSPRKCIQGQIFLISELKALTPESSSGVFFFFLIVFNVFREKWRREKNIVERETLILQTQACCPDRESNFLVYGTTPNHLTELARASISVLTEKHKPVLFMYSLEYLAPDSSPYSYLLRKAAAALQPSCIATRPSRTFSHPLGASQSICNSSGNQKDS